jgi:hypothetical protein
MATTTNYSWTTPDDTALVKDGAAAIRTLGSSVDTTTKALNPSTTLGDIEYRSSTANTNTRLGIGTTGQVLTVSGGVPSWATSSSGGMTLISTSTLNTASLTLSSIPQTYNNLYLVLYGMTGTVAARTVRVGPNNDFSNCSSVGFDDANPTQNLGCSIDLANQGNMLRTSDNNVFAITINNYSSTAGKKPFQFNGRYVSGGSATKFVAGFGVYDSTSAITSIVIDRGGTDSFSTGTVLFYGVK